MQTLKNGLFLTLGLIIMVWSFYAFLQKPAPTHYQTNPIVKIGNKTILVEIADDEAKRIQGLSGRKTLADNAGLLFIFERPAIQGFWMKDMRFPIDIIFLDEGLRVINVYEGVAPSTFPTLFYPLTLAQYVLEINSGEASRLGIDIGSQMILDR